MITMAKLTDEECEAAVQDALDSIPDEFLDELENVAFMLADEPDEEDYSRAGISAAGGELLGLYSGIAMTERGDDYGYAGREEFRFSQAPEAFRSCRKEAESRQAGRTVCS